MRHQTITRFAGFLYLTGLVSGFAFPAQTQPKDPGWPRQYTNGAAGLVVYQPQVDGWTDFKRLWGRCAFALTPDRGREPVYGTFHFEGDTLVDADRKIVLLRQIRVADVRFPSASAAASAQYAELTRRLMPTDAMVVSLDRLLAYVRAKEVPRQEARILTDPPPIHVSSQPAILVIVDGDPVMVDMEGGALERVVNTNWELLREKRTQAYYLRHNEVWLTSNDLHGAFALATSVPAQLQRPPQPAVAKLAAAPRVILVHSPAELIAIDGQPQLVRVQGTQVHTVTNTTSDLFFHEATRSYYFLASGRWFRASALQGPWQYVSQSLPPDFKNIPADHPKARVLSAVPGTREAEDAVLLAAIPRTATVNRSEAKADVQYIGSPQFVPIAGTSVYYAKNTPNDVLRVGDLYYLCLQGVWYVSTTAQGPWQAADKVPQAIYTIPESSPKYNVTYVRIYESTPTTIVVGYTPGYYGAYVSGGVVVWGTGYYYPPYVAVGVAAAPVYWGAGCYTYGAAAYYNPATGVYARGAAVYGPYGGYGAGAAYNPRTGTYAQGAAVAGSYGGAAAGRTYNPYNGNYSAGYSASTPYGSRGEGVVGNGDNWARGGYQSTSRGTIAAGQTSSGGAGVAVQGAGGNTAYAARSGSGDVYAGANGNVYKREDGQWYQNQNGSWNAMDKSNVESQRQQAAARDHGSRNAQMSERQRPSFGGGGGGFGGGGGMSRPQGGGQRSRPAGRR